MSPLAIFIPVLFCSQGGAVLYTTSNTFTLAAFHAPAVAYGCLHGDAADCNGLVIGRTKKLSMYMVYAISRMSSSPKSRLLWLAFRNISYSAGRA